MRRIDDLLDSFLGIRDMELGEKLDFYFKTYVLLKVFSQQLVFYECFRKFTTLLLKCLQVLLTFTMFINGYVI